MARHTRVGWLVICCGLWVSTFAQAQSPAQMVQQAWALYRAARFEAVLTLTRKILAHPDLPVDLKIETLALHAYAAIALGHTQTAREMFQSILESRPNWSPPPEAASPKIKTVFEAVVQGARVEVDRWRQRLTALLRALTERDYARAEQVWSAIRSTAWRNPRVREAVRTWSARWQQTFTEWQRMQARLRDMVRIPATPAATIGVGRDARKVSLEAFYMDRYPVTWEQYAAVLGARGKSIHIPPGRARHPVVNVTYHEAETFCTLQGKQLPTAEQWEYAARGSKGYTYPWGYTFDKRRCNTKESKIGHTTPVDAFPDGASPFGVYDLCGNAWEWTRSRDRKGRYIIKGGSFREGRGRALNYTARSLKPDERRPDVGFRCVLPARAVDAIWTPLLTTLQATVQSPER